MWQRSILVVEDEPLIAMMLEDFLESLGHSVTATCESVQDAIVEAGRRRLRPILMTAVTAIFGSLPLALGLEDGGELLRPLAIAFVGGLAVATLLTLVVIPNLYLLAHAGRERLAARFGRGGRRPERAAPRRTAGSMTSAM